MTSTTSVSRDPVAPWKLWTGRVLSVLPGLAFLPSAAMKLMQKPEFLTAWTGTFGYPAGTATPIGIIELACLALYWVPRTRVLGAILLTGYLGGAISTHVRAGQPFVIPLVIGIVVWAGLFLRDPRLHALLPLADDSQVK
jgi:hypothetical protein